MALDKVPRLTPQSSESEERYRTLIEFAPDSIVVHRDLRILYINPAGAALLGSETPDALIGRALLDFTHPDYHQQVRDRLGQLGQSGARVPLVRQRLVRLDGSEVDVEVASAAFMYRGAPAFLTIGRDLTERRRLEEELRQAQKMEAVGELTSGIAHDFKNILSVILTTGELLEESVPSDDAEARAGLNDLRTAARRGAEMIRRLMAFSRRAELRPAPIHLPGVIRDAHTLLRRILPEKVDIQLALRDDVAPVQADESAVEQIILNLGTNARDAMPQGGTLRIEVRPLHLDAAQVWAAGRMAPGDYACIEVADTGTGMDRRTLARVFEPFFTTKAPGKGTGLGMAMVHGLVTQLGGGIALESEPGKGTTITMAFPAVAGEAVRAAAAPPAEDVRGGAETVLIAEDEEALRRASKRVLERLGYTVLVAADGEEALQLVRQKGGEIGLVISDTVMPRLDGFALYHAMRDEAPQVPFMLSSGYQPADLADQGAIPRDVPFIAKPWTFSEFARKVRQVLDQRGAAP